MIPKTAAAALVATLVAAFASAQEARDEFRGSGGEIDVRAKSSRELSGSIGIFAGSTRGYEATLGGTVVEDRLWFFGSAQQRETEVTPRFAPQVLQGTGGTLRAVDGKLDALLGDRNSLVASFGASRDSGAAVPPDTILTIPSSAFSLHYTGIVSSSMFFSGSVSRRKSRAPLFPGIE